MHKKNIWLVVALVAVLIAVVGVATACGGGGTSGSKGGTLNVYINEPVAIEPLNLEESEGTQVGQALFDSLAAFDPITSEIVPAAAEKW